MQQKTVLSAVFVAGLLVTAGAVGALALGAGNVTAQVANGDKSVTVSASGEMEATADQAVVRVAVTATGNDSNAVREELASDAEAMRSALESYGIPDDHIRTMHYDISQERERTPEGVEAGQFRGTHAFEITVNDTEAAGEVIDTAVENGADRVMGVSFTLSDEKRAELHNEALEAAMENAESRAGAIASAGDIAITGVHTVVSDDTNYRPYTVEYASAGDAAATASTSVESGPVTVTAHVRVTYNATAA